MKIVTKIAIQLATTVATGFCFTLGAHAWKKISEKTGVLKPTEEK